MKVLHIVHQYLPEQVGGTESYTHWVTQRLAQRGHQVSVFYRRNAEATDLDSRNDEGVQTWAVSSGLMTARSRFMAVFKSSYILDAFRRVVDDFQPELVHIQHLLGLPIAILDYIRHLDIPFIVTLHDYWWICANAQLLTNYSQQRCNGPNLYLNCARCAMTRSGHSHLWPALPAVSSLLAWRNYRLRQALEAAHTLIAPTEFVSNWYQMHGVSADRLQVIPHGLDLPPLRVTRPAKDRPLRFAYIGGLSWQKGVHVLLEAFQELENKAELWIAGDETAEPEYVSQLYTLASSGVQFLGRLSHKAVWETLSEVDVIVVPSLWYETFSIIISEAFAAGVPVIASRLGPLVDRVQDKVDGLLIAPGDPEALKKALLRFVEEPNLLSHLRDGIRPVFTLDEHVSKLETVYQAAIPITAL